MISNSIRSRNKHLIVKIIKANARNFTCNNNQLLLRHHAQSHLRKLNQQKSSNKLESDPISQNTSIDTEHFVEKDLLERGFSKVNVPESLSKTYLDYLQVNNTAFKKSSKNLNVLKEKMKQLSGPTKTPRPENENENENDQQKYISIINSIFHYLVNESYLEITRFNTLGPEKISQIVESDDFVKTAKFAALQNNEMDEQLLFDRLKYDLFKDTGNPGKLQSTTENYWKMTKNLFNVLELIDRDQKNVALYESFKLEEFVSIFEFCKKIPVKSLKLKGLCISGNLIYRNNPKLRMDPINESFYIESLMNYGSAKKAILLVRNSTERIHQRWWNEVGLMCYLSTNQLKKFKKMFKETINKFGDDYIDIRILKKAIWKNLSFCNNIQEANYYCDLFIKIVERYGCEEYNPEQQIMQNTTSIFFRSQEEGNLFLNRPIKPTDKDFYSVISSFLSNGQYQRAKQLLTLLTKKMNNTIKEKNNFLITSTALYLATNVNELLKHTEPNSNRFDQHFTKHYLHNIKYLQEVHLNSFNSIFLKNLIKLSKNSKYNDLIVKFIMDNLLKDNIMDQPYKIRAIIRVLLNDKKITLAKQILEATEKLSKNDDPTITIYYSEFVMYYASEIGNLLKSKHVTRKRTVTISNKNKICDKDLFEKYKNEVELVLMKHIEDQDIPVSAEFLSASLKYYIISDQLGKSIDLVNDIAIQGLNLYAEDEFERTSSELESNPALYYSILCVYYRYYYSLKYDTYYKYSIKKFPNKNSLVNCIIKIPLEDILHKFLIKRNILPNDAVIGKIIQTLVVKDDYNMLLLFLNLLDQKLGVTVLNQKNISVILDALKQSYVYDERGKILEKEKNKDNSTDLIFIHKDSYLKALKIVKDKIKRGDIMSKLADASSSGGITIQMLNEIVVEYLYYKGRGNNSSFNINNKQNLREIFHRFGFDSTKILAVIDQYTNC
ncbi:Sov1p SCDLUD_003104 [Saccharomycodes ludwigii]|uniref:Sov1p n=1 Tax=Saccharomycodes ludwigii TaxID=36035 RepID=UPI001E84B7EE|nr:hypothetical protein SCDLUD_003104 [Saccharomycodes ludwigii]KAH3900136.1 hypothetical protein SCDLUD_003104 [Saccharomycodes ludwigii]